MSSDKERFLNDYGTNAGADGGHSFFYFKVYPSHLAVFNLGYLNLDAVRSCALPVWHEFVPLRSATMRWMAN